MSGRLRPPPRGQRSQGLAFRSVQLEGLGLPAIDRAGRNAQKPRGRLDRPALVIPEPAAVDPAQQAP